MSEFDHVSVIIVLCAFLAFGFVSRKLEGSILTGPMVFAGFGLLVGSSALGFVPVNIGNTAFHALAEITLILVLFSDAAGIDLGQLRRDHNLPVRMLLVGLPLTIVVGAVTAALLLPGLSIWEAALLAALLAPTDAALGQAVITNDAVPVRIRQALNVESGLNDGIALTIVLILASLASAMSAATGAAGWILFAAKQVTLGPLAGAAVGYLGARLVRLCYRTDWMSEQAEGMIALALALAAFALAELIGGNGFVAAFVAGLIFGNTLAHMCRFLFEFAESEGQILVLLTFLVFGGAMIPEAMADAQLSYFVFAALSLTVLRMVPVHLSLVGARIRPVTSAFLGWFGPRGLASVLFVILILEEVDVPHRGEIFAVTVVTVLLSIVLHGITAGPFARGYGAKVRAMPECEERRPVPETPFSAAG